MSQAAPADAAAPLNTDLLWGIATIAVEIGRSERQCYHLIETGVLPARRVGGRWCASRAALRAFFATATKAG